jgi:hypothetical protein
VVLSVVAQFVTGGDDLPAELRLAGEPGTDVQDTTTTASAAISTARRRGDTTP